MTAIELKKRISELVTHVTFEYRGKQCGVDPLSATDIEMWYGDEEVTAKSIDEVMSVSFFDEKSLNDIADKLEMINE